MPLKKILIGLLLFFLCFAVYLHNLSRAVTAGDVGDFISAASVAGVPHAPGYPLFTFLGFLLTRISFMTPAFMVGLISAVSSCFSVLLFYFLSLKFTKNKLIALISALILAFNYLFWFYSEFAEVFALNVFFVVVLFFLGFLYYKTGKDKVLYFLAFFTGLSITNHQTIVLIFPSIIILIFANFFKPDKIIKNIFISFIFFLLGFSVYLYVPVASHFNPPINWDNVKDIRSFLHLILRQDYGTFKSGSPTPVNSGQRVVILNTYFFDLISQLTLPVVLVSLLGVLKLIKKDKKLLISILLAFFISGPLFIAYAGFPLETDFYLGVYERFFVMSSVILLFLFPFGLLFFANVLNKLMRKTSFNNLFIGVFLIIPALLFYYNFPKTDLHNIYIGDRLGYDFMSPLPKNSLLLMSGDTPLFNVWYVKYSLKFRPDIEVVNINGLGADSYIKSESSKYLNSHPKDKSNPDLFVQVVRNISKTRPVFSLVQIQPKNGDKNIWVPYGLVFKLLLSKKDIPSENEFVSQTNDVLSRFRKPGALENKSIALQSLSIADIPSAYSNAYLRIGSFIYTQYKDANLAYSFFNKAVKADPNVYQNYDVLGLYYLSAKKDCFNAENNLNKAKDIYPFDNISYYLLYLTYKYCFNNKLMAGRIVSEYNNTFQSNFFSDIKKNKSSLSNYK